MIIQIGQKKFELNLESGVLRTPSQDTFKGEIYFGNIVDNVAKRVSDEPIVGLHVFVKKDKGLLFASSSTIECIFK